MVKKEQGRNLIEMFETIMSGLSGLAKSLVGKVQDVILYTEEKVMQILYASVLLVTGLVFLAASAVALMNEYLGLSKGWSYLIISLVLILSSLIIKNKAMKDLKRR